MNLTLTLHLLIQFSDTPALIYQGGREVLWPSKSHKLEGQISIFQENFLIILWSFLFLRHQSDKVHLQNIKG